MIKWHSKFQIWGSNVSSIKLISLDMDFAMSNNKQVGILVGNNTIDNILSLLPDNDNIRYIIIANGALIYDIKNDEIIYDVSIREDEAIKYLELVSKEEVMVQIVTYDEIVQERKNDYSYYNMNNQYANKQFKYVDDIIDYLKKDHKAIYKINLYHHTIIGCKRNRQRLSALGLNIATCDKTSIECTKKSLDLKKICKILKISVEDMIVVSDDNLFHHFN